MTRSTLIFPIVCSFLAACSGSGDETPQGSTNIGPAAIVRGNYTLQQNGCRTKCNGITIIQDLTTLILKPSADCQGQLPNELDGYLDESGTVHFTIEGETTTTCTATLADSTLSGSCAGGGESCNFSYQRKSEE